eukprot:128040-Rhodomonas_salina.3
MRPLMRCPPMTAPIGGIRDVSTGHSVAGAEADRNTLRCISSGHPTADASANRATLRCARNGHPAARV